MSSDPTTTAAHKRRWISRPITVTMSARSWLLAWMLALVGALYTVVGVVLAVSDVIR